MAVAQRRLKVYHLQTQPFLFQGRASDGEDKRFVPFYFPDIERKIHPGSKTLIQVYFQFCPDPFKLPFKHTYIHNGKNLVKNDRIRIWHAEKFRRYCPRFCLQQKVLNML